MNNIQKAKQALTNSTKSPTIKNTPTWIPATLENIQVDSTVKGNYTNDNTYLEFTGTILYYDEYQEELYITRDDKIQGGGPKNSWIASYNQNLNNFNSNLDDGNELLININTS